MRDGFLNALGHTRTSARRVLAAGLSALLLCHGATAQLILGSDQPNPSIWVADVSRAGAPRSLLGGANVRVYGLAADNTGQMLYWLDNGTSLYKAPFNTTGPLVPGLVGSTTVSGVGVSFVSLAFDAVEGKLYGYRNSNDAQTEGIYEISTTNASAVRVCAIDPAADFGGMDYDAATDAFYATNDGAGAYAGRGVYRIAKPLSTPVVTLISAYPGSDSDIDGLAAGNGRLYLVNDAPAEGIYVLNLTSRQYETTLPNPFTALGTFCGGAWAPGLFVPPSGADLSVTLTISPDCSVAVGGVVRCTVAAFNAGPQEPQSAELIFTFPLDAEYVSSTPPGVVTMDTTEQTLTIALGAIGESRTIVVPIEIRALPRPMGGLTFSTGVRIQSELPDQNSGNNTASQSKRLAPSIPTSAVARGVLSTVPSSPTSRVPGAAGLRFSDVLLPGRPVRSAGGARWMQRWNTDAADTTTDQVLVTSDMMTMSVAAREGMFPQIPAQQGGDSQPPPYFPFGPFDPAYGINDAGDIIFSGIDSHDGTLNDGYIVAIVGGVLTQIVQERTTPAPPSTGGLRYGASPGGTTPARSACAISPAGAGAFMHTIEGVPADRAQFVLRAGGQVIARAGVTVPLGQAMGESAAVREFDACTAQLGVFFNADHTRYIASCTLNTNAARDRAVVVDGRVVAQEGSPLPGGSPQTFIPADGIRAVRMESNGTWFIRGGYQNGKDWVVRDGITVASSGDPVFRGSAERFTDAANPACFFLMLSNNRRDVVIGGATDAADAKTREVLVRNRRTIIARANDPVDLDGNGLFDDGVFIRSFLDDMGFMTDSSVFVTVRLRGANAALCGGADADEGIALMEIPLPARPCVADVDDGGGQGVPDGGVTIDDLLYFISLYDAGSPDADVDDGTGSGVPDDGVTIDDLLYFLARFESGC